ncbi:MAG: sigma-70 family RNA polymerase sigma factor [Oscillospiraceae bacterium]|nr:sigma-70 family RNA polymerase sigma factor [Oscillospiraceae bacterium]
MTNSLLTSSDEILVAELRRYSDSEASHDQIMSALITRYVNVIVIKANKTARSFGLFNKQDAEDFISEGFLALLSAIKTYDARKAHQGGFSAYANVCIDNRMKNALGKARRTFILSEEFDPALVKEQSPAADELVIEKETRAEILKRIDKVLSPREFAVFELYLDSFSYRQIAQTLNISEKSVDNALSRARTKLKAIDNGQWIMDNCSKL